MWQWIAVCPETQRREPVAFFARVLRTQSCKAQGDDESVALALNEWFEASTAMVLSGEWRAARPSLT